MVKTLGVKVPEKIHYDLKEICERERVTISDILYDVLTEFIENYKNFREAEGKEARMWKND